MRILALLSLLACPSAPEADPAPVAANPRDNPFLRAAEKLEQPPSVRPETYDSYSYEGPSSTRARVAAARERKQAEVEALFATAGVTFPPAQLLLRGFKAEDLLEVWAADSPEDPLVHVTTYQICAASGQLGPKRRQGDLQVPEGFYELDTYNDQSAFYLSMRINYPNRSDRILGHPQHPGGDIFIHGSCVSIGCLAMSDERIQELWLMARACHERGRAVQVHLFPSVALLELAAAQPEGERKEFWGNLAEGYSMFEREKRLPRVRVDGEGRYSFE